jgi:hypothetical protein
MNVRRVVYYGVSALAIASWFASASTSGVRTPAVPVPSLKPTPLDRSSAELQAEVARLHARLAPTAIPSHARDLFHFSGRAPRNGSAAPAPAPAAVIAAAPVTVSRPSLTLIGIAEDASDEGTVRTAIVSGLGDVFLVKAGDTIAGRYRVEQVSGDAALVTDITTASQTTLALR